MSTWLPIALRAAGVLQMIVAGANGRVVRVLDYRGNLAGASAIVAVARGASAVGLVGRSPGSFSSAVRSAEASSAESVRPARARIRRRLDEVCVAELRSDVAGELVAAKEAERRVVLIAAERAAISLELRLADGAADITRAHAHLRSRRQG